MSASQSFGTVRLIPLTVLSTLLLYSLLVIWMGVLSVTRFFGCDKQEEPIKARDFIAVWMTCVGLRLLVAWLMHATLRKPPNVVAHGSLRSIMGSAFSDKGWLLTWVVWVEVGELLLLWIVLIGLPSAGLLIDTVLCMAFILRFCYSLYFPTIHTLYVVLEAAPSELPHDRIHADLLAIPGVSDVAKLRIWALTYDVWCATVVLNTAEKAERESVLKHTLSLLNGRWKIASVTVELRPASDHHHVEEFESSGSIKEEEEEEQEDDHHHCHHDHAHDHHHQHHDNDGNDSHSHHNHSASNVVIHK